LALKPNYVGALNNLGNALTHLGQLDNAVACYYRALALNPSFAEAYNNLGNTYNPIGKTRDALFNYRKALEKKSDYFDAYSNLLMASNYIAQSPADYLMEASDYGKRITTKVTSRYTTWQCNPKPERLRVGIVSADLHSHPVGYFLESFLAQLDPSQIELIAYTNTPICDDLTARIKPYFSAWKPVFALNDIAAAQLIHADGVHVLLDLSGHTANNRLPMFAWKPAPVQCTWLGYFASTGVAEMDYILGDQWVLPDNEAHHFVEKGWRLTDTLSCLTPPSNEISVATLPALQNQRITFGTLNNAAKMNDRVVACWARILNNIPNSQLYLNTKSLNDQAVRRSVIDRYAAEGIADDRLILDATSGRIAALNSYSRIDIALDPFPYPGGTSSYESLWMGVPILTLKGNHYISHLGESIMHNAGLSDWIATSEDDYVAKAIHFASDLPRLAALRAGLREQVRISPLFDAPRFAKNFEDALWGMWRAKTMQETKESSQQ
jgi:protein O-GlcNAc transferase